MIRPPPRATRTDTLFPYTPLFRSAAATPMSAGPGRISAARPWRRGLLRGFDRQHVRIDPEHAFGPRKGVEEPREQVRPDLARDQFGRRLLAAAADEFPRSEEHTSELQSLMRISYAVFCLKKKKITKQK